MKSKSKRITVEMLRRYGICEDGRERFARIFPNGAPITFQAARKAAENNLAPRYLSKLLRGKYASQFEEHARGKAVESKAGLHCCDYLVISLLRKQFNGPIDRAERLAWLEKPTR